jgi:hypothetical protein
VVNNKRGEIQMNKLQIIALLKDGAYLDSANSRLHHPSFVRKGWRAMTFLNISFSAACTALKGSEHEVGYNNGIYKSKSFN